MKKKIVRKNIVLGIVILFVGAGVIPSIAANIEQSNVISTKENDIKIIPQQTFFGDPLDEAWNKTFGGTNDDIGEYVMQTSDNGYIIAGRTGILDQDRLDVLLIKVDSSGNESWNKTFGDSGDGRDWSECVQQTSDGGYIVGGTTSAYAIGYYDWWLIKTDTNGIMEWNKTYGGLDLEVMQRVYQTSDNGYILIGNTFSYGAGGGDVWLIKTDSNGTMTWNKTFGGTSDEYGYDVSQTTDEGYIIIGRTDSFGAGGTDLWMIKTDENGTQLWNKTYGSPDYDFGHSIQETADGGYIIGGVTTTPENHEDAWLILTDSNGTMIWNKTYGGLSDDDCHTVRQTVDNKYILSGTRDEPPGDFWLIKTDFNGTIEWNQTFGGPDVDYGKIVQQTSDTGFIFVGETLSFGAGMRDIWLIKMKPENQLPIADFIYTPEHPTTINTVSFTDNSSDLDGVIISWDWGFDDGNSSTEQNPTHLYTNPGSYDVTLSIVDDYGSTATITKQIIVESLEFKIALIFGRITNVTNLTDIITFEAVKTRVITLSPINFITYSSNEIIFIQKDVIGYIGQNFIFALCKASLPG